MKKVIIKVENFGQGPRFFYAYGHRTSLYNGTPYDEVLNENGVWFPVLADSSRIVEESEETRLHAKYNGIKYF